MYTYAATCHLLRATGSSQNLRRYSIGCGHMAHRETEQLEEHTAQAGDVGRWQRSARSSSKMLGTIVFFVKHLHT